MNTIDPATATTSEWTQFVAAEGMLDAIEGYESLTGDLFDPTHANARPELRRIAAKSFGVGGWKYVCKEDRTLVDGVIARLLPMLAARFVEVAA